MYIHGARFVAIILLAANFILTTIVCICAGTSVIKSKILDPENLTSDYSNDYSNGEYDQNYTRLELILIFYSIPAGMVSMTAVITGVHHVRVWDLATAVGAQATAWISWMFILCAMCFAAKDSFKSTFSGIHVLEICLIVLTILHFIYTLALYIPDGSLRANLDPPDEYMDR